MKSVVVEIQGDKAVLMTDQSSFVSVKNRNYFLGQKVSHRRSTLKTAVAVAACLAVVSGLSIGGYASYVTPYSYVTIDINPSFSLSANIYNRVIDITPLNSDAEDLLAASPVSYGGVSECVADLVNTSEKMGYINENNTDVTVDVVSGKKNLYKQINEKVAEECSDTIFFNVKSASREDYDKAASLNISIRRLNAIKDYTNKNGGTVNENARLLEGKKIDEIDSSSIKAENTANNEKSTPAEITGKKAEISTKTADIEKKPSENSTENKSSESVTNNKGSSSGSNNEKSNSLTKKTEPSSSVTEKSAKKVEAPKVEVGKPAAAETSPAEEKKEEKENAAKLANQESTVQTQSPAQSTGNAGKPDSPSSNGNSSGSSQSEKPGNSQNSGTGNSHSGKNPD
ncbi:MAG: hypothetical protein Q8873_04450 [Bacillota bacterium]|nr:hypothetical protein [Bacillota bacterium]